MAEWREGGGGVPSACVVDLTFALVLFIYSESSCTADGLSAPMDPRENPWLLRLVWWNRVWWGGLISLLADVDDGALREAEVSTKVVDTLHPSFAGII